MMFSMKGAVLAQENSLSAQEAKQNMLRSCGMCTRLCRESSCPMWAAYERNVFIFSVQEGLKQEKKTKKAGVREWTILA